MDVLQFEFFENGLTLAPVIRQPCLWGSKGRAILAFKAKHVYGKEDPGQSSCLESPPHSKNMVQTCLLTPRLIVAASAFKTDSKNWLVEPAICAWDLRM